MILDLPPSHFMVPYERNRFLVGRDALHQRNFATRSRSIADQHHSITAVLLYLALAESGKPKSLLNLFINLKHPTAESIGSQL